MADQVTDFQIKTYRCEWQVVIQEIDDTGYKRGEPKVLSSWPTREQAVADRPNHGREERWRWVPHGVTHGYVKLEIIYREVLIDVR